MKLKVTPKDAFLGSEPPRPSGFPEPLTPPSVRFSSMPSVLGVWTFSGITHWTAHVVPKHMIHAFPNKGDWKFQMGGVRLGGGGGSEAQKGKMTASSMFCNLPLRTLNCQETF